MSRLAVLFAGGDMLGAAEVRSPTHLRCAPGGSRAIVNRP